MYLFQSVLKVNFSAYETKIQKHLFLKMQSLIMLQKIVPTQVTLLFNIVIY